MKQKASRPVATAPMNTTHAYVITHPGHALEGPHIGAALAKDLKKRHWHVLRNVFANDPQPETYEAVMAAKKVTPTAMQKLVTKAMCARQIEWPNQQSGILLEIDSSGYYLAVPA